MLVQLLKYDKIKYDKYNKVIYEQQNQPPKVFCKKMCS